MYNGRNASIISIRQHSPSLIYLPFMVEVCVEAKRAKRPRVVKEGSDKVMTVRHALCKKY